MQTNGPTIRSAWGIPTQNQRPVTVALIDTGVDQSHPALADSVVDGVSFTGDSVRDNNGQGTHLAGIIANRQFTNYGAEKVDVASPGQEVSVPASGEITMKGTGLACATISGLAAHLLAADPNLSPQELMTKLTELQIPAYISK